MGRDLHRARTTTRYRKGLVGAAISGAVATALLGAPVLASTAWADTAPSPSGQYIVTDLGSSDASAAAADTAAAGGSVQARLDSAESVLTTLTSDQASQLSGRPGVSVVPDTAVSFEGSFGDMPATRAPAAVFPQQTGAVALWSQGDAGAGVNVAVLDTGIAPLPDFAGRLVGGVDLSGEGNAFADGYGHGTFVAGLIAGNGASSAGAYMGEAPQAGLVSVKVADASGHTDLATVIAGVDWTIAEQHALHIDVLNVSLGYRPFKPTGVDPLDVALENAWRSGITVVTSAGNYGPFNGTITAPGDDPLVITAGAVDDQGQTKPSQDTMTAFSSVGPTFPNGWIKPDLVASGRSVVSLAAPGSTVFDQNPGALIGTSNFVGSGTSFSGAITSGAAALLLQSLPGISPDEVKARLLASTFPGPVGNPIVDGHGILDAFGAVNDGAQGAVQLTQFGSAERPKARHPASWAESSWNPANWTVGAWVNPNWTGTAWNGTAWNGTAWDGSAWNGSAWNGSAWNGSAWNGSAWNGSAWNGSAWNGSAWNGSAWNGSAWNGSAWNGSAWNGSAWNSSAWN